ncbi:hypothetical protein MTR67_039328 [Solanum verrucosum]|uniref:Uncharacterized protein n=1 Tax=Solanum verrucosum TaxID=315347 RepID=A0AAF0UI88_SOLVR|nr:hypothetical protein MTR67_039328 [Solanum verrucosum]
MKLPKQRLPFTSHFTTRCEDHELWGGSWGCISFLGVCQVRGGH